MWVSGLWGTFDPVTETTRTPTAIDQIAEDYHLASVALSPIAATSLGMPGHDHELDDFSPAGLAAHADLARTTLEALRSATPVDAVDTVTVAAMAERLDLHLRMHEAGIGEMSLNVLASPLQEMRDIFDLMPDTTDEHWAIIAQRLAKIPGALAGYQESLLAARARGNVSPKRQVRACAEQCEDLVAPDGYFAGLAARAAESAPDLTEQTRASLESASAAAASAYEQMGRFLTDELLDSAPTADACGRERYALLSQYFLGAVVDLEETYQWGQEELARITAEMAQVAERIRPGATVVEAIEVLHQDTTYRLDGTDALRTWMQGKADEVIVELAGTHFDIAEPIRTIECMIAPTQTGGIYYTQPSEDFSRPGRMWWSVPKGVTEFETWSELTTVYHEGVPGHHLQVAQAVYLKDTLNSWRRLHSWTSGHGEGWALYAERLMADLGYMDDPGNRMGMLDGQSLRAARVVIDIGVHCGFEAPAEVGGGEWTYDKAWDFLRAHAFQKEEFLRFELNRYLGWPGQAPSYKIGERLWMQMRDELHERDGDAFDIKDFHKRALDIGGVGLDVLRDAVLG